MPHETAWADPTKVKNRPADRFSNIHHAGECPCIAQDSSSLAMYRRRHSPQSRLAQSAVQDNGVLVDSRRSSDDAESDQKKMEKLRTQLDRTLTQNGRDALGSPEGPEDPALSERREPVPVEPNPRTIHARTGSVMAAFHGTLPEGTGVSIALNDTPATTAPSSPRMTINQLPSIREAVANIDLGAPARTGSGTSTPRVRPTTLDIPGLTKSKVSPDGRIAQRDVGSKLVIVMVGLPARGKSYITKKLARYLNWLQHDTRIFNVGEKRRIVAGGPYSLEKSRSRHNGQIGATKKPAPSVSHESQDRSSTMGSSSGEVQSTTQTQIILNDDTRLEPPATPRPAPTIGDECDDGGLALDRQQSLASQVLCREGPEVVPPAEEALEQNAAFFDPQNKKAAQIREQVALETLDDLLDFILVGNGSVGILDATNSTLARRKLVMDHIRERAGPQLNVLFLESRCMDPDLLEANMRLKLNGPDYRHMDPTVALDDFKKRVREYEKAYVPLGEYEERNNMPYIQMIDVGRKCISHQIKGFLMAQANYYLLNFNLAPRQIWITRHGLSQDNLSGKIGGDSNLSLEGHEYARSLARFIQQKRKEWDIKQIENLKKTHFPPQPGDVTPPNPYYQPQSPPPTSDPSSPLDPLASAPAVGYEPKSFCVWTSMLQRSIQTAQYFNDEDYDIKQMRMLDELNAGVMEGLTYACISQQFPEEYQRRKADKLHYRYPGPGGEGYLDIINRLRPVIVELERMTDHVLLIGHRSVARVLLAYFRGLEREAVADLDVPIGLLYCLEPKPYGVDFRTYRWDKRSQWFHELSDFELTRATDDMVS